MEISMKKRAKQLAMLGLTVTMMCGTQIKAFAADTEEVAPVSIETEAKAETIEVKEEVTDKVAEPKLSITADKTTFDGTQDIVVTMKADFDDEFHFYGDVPLLDGVIVGNLQDIISDNEYRMTISKDELQRAIAENGYKNGQTAVLTTGFGVEYTDENGEYHAVDFPTLTLTYSDGTVTPEINAELTEANFTTAVDGVITLTDEDLDEYGRVEIPVVLHGTPSGNTAEGGVTLQVVGDDASGFGYSNFIDKNKTGEYVGSFVSHKNILVQEGGSKTFNGKFKLLAYVKGGPKVLDTLEYSITVKYVGGDTDNGGGTVTPEPEKDGWIKTEEGWKYYENGQKATGWKAVSENWYYFNEDGIMETGWVSVGGYWYYMNSSGAMETGWTSVGSHWYYLNADGTMETGWVSVGGHWYYLNADGSMATGWASVGGHWYYLNADGTMATGWVSVGSHWYYLNADGTMATGWASVGGHWYYLNTDGTMASNQWIDGWYVDASGKML